MIEFRSPTEIFARSEELVVHSDREAAGSNCDESRSKYYKDDIFWLTLLKVSSHPPLQPAGQPEGAESAGHRQPRDVRPHPLLPGRDWRGADSVEAVWRLSTWQAMSQCLCQHQVSKTESLTDLWLTAPATQCQHGRSPSECHSGQTGTPLPAATHRRRLLSPCWRLSVCRDWSLGLSRLLSFTSKYDQDLQTWAEGSEQLQCHCHYISVRNYLPHYFISISSKIPVDFW